MQEEFKIKELNFQPANLEHLNNEHQSKHAISLKLKKGIDIRCFENKKIVEKSMRAIDGKSIYLVISNINDKNEKARVLDMRYLKLIDEKERGGRVSGSFWAKHKVLKLTLFDYTLTIVMESEEEYEKWFHYFTCSINELENISTHEVCESRSITSLISQSICNGQNIKFEDIIQIEESVRISLCGGVLKQEYEKLIGKSLGEIASNPTCISLPLLPVKTFLNYVSQTQQQKCPSLSQPNLLSLSDFCLYFMCCSNNYVTNPEPLDEDHPLTSYFCYSSHNTYLSGNQLTSSTEVERYKEDLYNGLKSVEIDIHWDGDVTHAVGCFSMSNTVDFESVIKSIYDYHQHIISIGKVHYPIILSLENHVETHKRDYLVKCLSRYFNDKAYFMEGSQELFPTLRELRNKIVVKTSTCKSEAQKLKFDDVEIGSLSSSFNSQKSLPSTLSSRFTYFKSLQPETKKSSGSFLCFGLPKKLSEKQPKEPMATVTGIFKSRDGIENIDPCPFVCTSLNNKNFMKAKREKLIEYTMRSWLRTYPQNWIKSSNYNPTEMLNVGAQLIALNTQTKDINLLALHSYFMFGEKSSNNLCGYRLKPSYLRKNGSLVKSKTSHIKFSVVQNFGHKIKMTFLGVKEDIKRNEGKFKNGCEIIVDNVDCSFVVFNIGNSVECVPLRYLQTGFRVLIGRNPHNNVDKGIRILMHISKST